MFDKYDQNLLLGYVEGDLSPADAARVEKLLADDPRLRTLLEAMRCDRQALRAMPPEAVPAGLMEQITLRLERRMLLDEPTPVEQTRRDRQTFRLHRTLIYSGLAAMILISAGVVLSTLMSTTPTDWMQQPPTRGIAMDDGQPKRDARAAWRAFDDDASLSAEAQAEAPVEAERTGKAGLDRADPLLADADLGRFASKVGIASRADGNETTSEAMAMKTAPAPVDAPASRREVPATVQSVQEPPTRYFARLVPIDEASTLGPGALAADTNATGQQELMFGQAALQSTTLERVQPKDRAQTAEAASIALNIDTDNPLQTRRQLRQWAFDNHVVLVDDRSRASGVEADGVMPADVAKASEPESDAARDEAETPVYVVVQGAQIPDLLAYLEGDSQAAYVVPSLAPRRRGEVDRAEPAAAPRPDDGPTEPQALMAGAAPRPMIDPAPAQPVGGERLAIDLSNRWADLLQQQLPLQPRVPVVGQDDALLLPVVINARAAESPAEKELAEQAAQPGRPVESVEQLEQVEPMERVEPVETVTPTQP